MLLSIDPTNGETIAAYDEIGDEQIEAALHTAAAAFAEYRRTPFSARATWLKNAAAVLRRNRREYAGLMTLEMGKPITQALAEVDKCAWVCDYYAENGEEFLRDRETVSDASRSYVTFAPLGPILAVMPWNFPFWQVFRFAAPTLLAGNVGLLKHAANVSGCSLAIAEIFRAAEFPAGVWQSLLLSSARVRGLIADRRIQAVTLTGSTPAGRAVAACAGSHLKKTVLELGGSDPYLILEDADLPAAAAACATARLLNGGQSCIAAKRFIVHGAVYDEFEALLLQEMARRKVGHPMDESVDIGPLARLDLRDELQRQVETSLARGARLLLGGVVPDGPGAYYPPTVLSAVRKGMPAFDEELFGPVAALIRVRDEAEALQAAADTPFGLGAAVFSRDVRRAEALARDELAAGSCFVNTFVKSDPRLPFGGIRDSGYGRELSPFGILEFVNTKTVYIR